MVNSITRAPTKLSDTPRLSDTVITSDNTTIKEDLREIIRNAQWPTDIHGVVEKIAFRIGERYDSQRNQRPMPVNWEEAKDIFYRWAQRTASVGSSMRFETYLHQTIDEYAKTHRNCPGTDFDYWIAGQNQLADSIIQHYS